MTAAIRETQNQGQCQHHVKFPLNARCLLDHREATMTNAARCQDRTARRDQTAQRQHDLCCPESDGSFSRAGPGPARWQQLAPAIIAPIGVRNHELSGLAGTRPSGPASGDAEIR